MGDLLTPEQVAVKLGVSVRTLKEWRKLKTGPKSVRLSHTKVRYREDEVNSFIDDQERGQDDS